MRNPYVWRWSHTRHHTETVVVGRDPESAFRRPNSIFEWVLNLLYIPSILNELRKMVQIASGKLTKAERSLVREMDQRKAFIASRIQLAILVCVLGLSITLGSWLHHILETTQHAGLAEDIPHHQMNSHTVYLNPFSDSSIRT